MKKPSKEIHIPQPRPKPPDPNQCPKCEQTTPQTHIASTVWQCPKCQTKYSTGYFYDLWKLKKETQDIIDE